MTCCSGCSTIEFQLEQALSEKDSTLAAMELELKECDPTHRKQTFARVKSLQAEQNKLALQFKSKVNERSTLLRKDSDEILGALAREYSNCSREQVCIYSFCGTLLITGAVGNKVTFLGDF